MDFTHDIERCLQVLKQGGLILYPTDTVWGIGCDATNSEAVQKIFVLKQRPEKKAMIILLADPRDILKYVTQPDPRIFNYLETVQKPTTVIYEGAIGMAENLIPPEGTIAIRLVRDTFCRQLIKRFRKPIVSTSANISGEPAPRYFDEITEEIKTEVDYAVHYRQQDKTQHEPSAVVKWNRDGTATVIRS